MGRHVCGYLLLVLWVIATTAACQKSPKMDNSKMPTQLAEKLSDPTLGEEAFTNLCAEALRTIDPQATISVIGPFQVAMGSQEGDIVVGFENPWRSAPENRAEAVWRHALAIRQAAQDRKKQVPGELQEIVPLVRGEGDAAVQLIKEGSTKMLGEPLTGELWVLYSFNKPMYLTPVMETDLQRLGLEREQLRSTALKNLRQLAQGVERRVSGSTSMLILPYTGGSFEASLLLLDEIWEELEKEAQGELVAAVPTRDLLFVTDSHDKAGVSKVTAIAADAFAKGDHPVSEQVLIRRNGKWEPWVAPR